MRSMFATVTKSTRILKSTFSVPSLPGKNRLYMYWACHNFEVGQGCKSVIVANSGMEQKGGEEIDGRLRDIS